MKNWAWTVAGLYGAILIVLTVPVILAAFAPKLGVVDALRTYTSWAYWVWLAIMVLGQFALLSVPVRLTTSRPVTRRALWPTILAGGLMGAGLLFGAICSIWEFAAPHYNLSGYVALGIMFLAWAAWSGVFYWMGRRLEPADFVSRQCRLLLKGSILELLIAVPTHIAVRARNECCAGFGTFVGLTMGISVMLFSFGPAVFFLYAERWKRLHPRSAPAH